MGAKRTRILIILVLIVLALRRLLRKSIAVQRLLPSPLTPATHRATSSPESPQPNAEAGPHISEAQACSQNGQLRIVEAELATAKECIRRLEAAKLLRDEESLDESSRAGAHKFADPDTPLVQSNVELLKQRQRVNVETIKTFVEKANTPAYAAAVEHSETS